MEQIICEAVPLYEGASALAQYLVTDKAGVECQDDLKLVTAEMLKSIEIMPPLTPIQIIKVLKHFAKIGEQTENQSKLLSLSTNIVI